MAFFEKCVQVRMSERDLFRIRVAMSKNREVRDVSEYVRGAVIQRLSRDVPEGDVIAKDV